MLATSHTAFGIDLIGPARRDKSWQATAAMGCQKEVARAVREVPGADYLLAVKKNHPKLEAEISWLFSHHDQDGWHNTDSSVAVTQNTGHGRTETRECRLMRDLTVLEQAGE